MGRCPLAITLSAGIAGLLFGCNEDPAGGSDIPDASTNEIPDAAPDDCVAGTLLPCICPDGETGYAECVDDSWAECDCEEGEFPMFCGLCHGDWDYPAPPKDISGNTETSVVTVGAHRAHLKESDWHRRVECVDCHAVPKKMNSPGHIDPSPAELTFAKVSIADGALPLFDRTIATCAGTYCHGSTLTGFASGDPVWTDDDGSPGECGSCHSLPPGGSHPTDTECENCHGNVVAAGNEIIASNLHVDGIVQFSGEEICNICHGNPPTLANQDFPGGGGAHVKHVTDLGITCNICHGHNGTGPTHAPLGSATVDQVNVDIAFDLSVSYPGGTTMDNGLTTSFNHNGGNPTCNVGCHNPVVGDAASLGHQATWTDTEITCSDCHDQTGLNLPINHPVNGTDAQIRANCSECHDHSTHTTGTIAFTDPDPSDGIDPSTTSVAADLCKTCHDGGASTYFGGATAIDMSDSWINPRAHENHSVGCTSCHGHHGNSSGATLTADPEESGCASCHPTVVAEMAAGGSYTHHHVDDSDPLHFPVELECTRCHNPHVVDDSPWQPVINPDDGSLISVADVPSDHFSTAGSDTSVFCLTCHDGTQPAAGNIAAELASVWTINSQFFRGGGSTRNMHISHVSTQGFACTECHNAHSNTGTSGTNRGHLLYNYITVNTFPYTGKNSCGLSGGPTDCHH